MDREVIQKFLRNFFEDKHEFENKKDELKRDIIVGQGF